MPPFFDVSRPAVVFFLGNWSIFIKTLRTQGNLCVWLSENFIWASHPKSFMLNAFPLQKASHCWKYLKPQSEKQSKSSQFVLHHAICKTSSVLPLKTIISLIESMRQCLRFIQKLQDCETGKNAKMKYIYSLSEYWCIFWWTLCYYIARDRLTPLSESRKLFQVIYFPI